MRDIRRFGRLGRRAAAVFAALALVLMLLPLSGCAKNDWEGTWNRVGDSTFSRAVLKISDVKSKGFTFSMTLYNGNVAGRLLQLHAEFTDRTQQTAEYSVPDSRAVVTFEIDGEGGLFVNFFDSDVNFNETEYNAYSSSTATEMAVFDFKALVYISGQFTRGEVEYINSDFHEIGLLDHGRSDALMELMPEDTYIRCLDCFQMWETVSGLKEDPPNSDKHNDEIGGYVYYGSNTMQQYAAIIIAFDDGTVCAAVSQTNGSIVYYSNNAIYSSGELTPLPVQKWIELHNNEYKSGD